MSPLVGLEGVVAESALVVGPLPEVVDGAAMVVIEVGDGTEVVVPSSPVAGVTAVAGGQEGWELLGLHSFDLVGGVLGGDKGTVTLTMWKREIAES